MVEHNSRRRPSTVCRWPTSSRPWVTTNQRRSVPATKATSFESTCKTQHWVLSACTGRFISRLVSSLSRRVVSEDSLNWDKSGQWPFSCYAPLLRRLLAAGGGGATHIGGSMPGLTDYSPEEVRWQMYRHGGQGTVHQFVAQLQQLAAEYAAKRQALINMNERTVEFIVTCSLFQFSKFDHFSFRITNNVIAHSKKRASLPLKRLVYRVSKLLQNRVHVIETQ